MNIRFRTALAGVLGLALLFGPLASTYRAQILEQVLLKVNGEILTKTDLETRQVSALRSLGQYDPAKKPSDAELQKMLSEVTPQLMVSIVDEMLLVQRGKELGYTLTDEQFK